MKNFLTALFLLLLLASCRELEVEDMFYPQDPYMSIEKSADFSVRLAGDLPADSAELKSLFKEKSAEVCFARTARQVLQLQPLLLGSHAEIIDPEPGFFRFQGPISPVKAPLTGDLVQDFRCTLRVFPHFSIGGEIIGLEDDRTIVARSNRITMMLFRDYPEELPAYFVVGRKTSEQDINLIKIYGTGRIVQIVGEVGIRSDNEDGSAVMAQGLILETNHEVYKGDLVFLTSISIDSVFFNDDIDDPVPASTPDEVWVRPEVRTTVPEESEPGEMK